MARNWPQLPVFQSEEDAAAVAPEGWCVRQIEELFEKLPIGKRFDQKTAGTSGRVPVVDQSAEGFVGFHNEEPGVTASKECPVITFANHTCEMRVMRRPFSVIQNVFPMAGKRGICDSIFLYYSSKGRVHLEEYKGHYPDYRRLWIPVPPLAEQRTIAAVLGALDDKIELNRRMNETLEAMARALFKSWFVDFDPVRAKAEGRAPSGMDEETAKQFPSGFEDSESQDIPRGWEVTRIDSIASINSWSLSRSDTLEHIDYIEISEVRKGNIGTVSRYPRGSEPGRARRRLRHGDTVLSTVRPDRGSYFLCLDPRPSLIASTGFAVLTPHNNSAWAFLHCAVVRSDVFEHLGRRADGGAYPAVSPETIGEIKIPMPQDIAIIGVFQRICEPIFRRMESNRSYSASLERVRDALLPRLLSGEIDVSDAERFVGAAL